MASPMVSSYVGKDGEGWSFTEGNEGNEGESDGCKEEEG